MKRGLVVMAAVILTARLGVIEYQGHRETFYNKSMRRIVSRANEFYGIEGIYAEREDGVKTYNGLVICACDWDLHPYGSFVDTSRGMGVVLDTGTFTDRSTVDIAVTW